MTVDKKIILFLLNDTDTILLNVIKTKFKKDANWDSVIATSYEQGIKFFDEHNPDGVLTEIIINDDHGRTGFDFIQEIQKKNKKNLEIIIFTDLGLDDDKDRAKNLGINYYFVKSKVSLNELIEEVKNIISLK